MKEVASIPCPFFYIFAIVRTVILFIVLVFAFQVKAQYPAYTIFAEEQFSGINIYDVIQDPENRYYFATNQGIFQHDGYNYKRIACNEMKGASAFNFVSDSKGTIYCFNLHQQVFRIKDGNISVFYEIPKEAQHHDIWLLVDKNDNLLVQTKGITKLSPDGTKVELLTSGMFDGKASPLSFHALPDGSTISVAPSCQIARQKEGKFKVRYSPLLKDLTNEYGNIALFWITVDNITYAVERQSRNVYRLEPESLSLNFSHQLGNIDATSGMRLYTTEDRIWLIENSNGAYAFDASFSPLYNGKKIYADHFISDVYVDHEDNILLSTFDEGILLVPNNKVLGLQLENNEKITHITPADKQTIFIGTDQGNIYSYRDHILENIYSDSQRKGIEFLRYWPGQKLLLHTCSDGLQISRWNDSELRKLSHYPRSIKNIHFIDGEHAIGAFNYGLARINQSGKGISYRKIPELERRSYCVVQDNHTIYAGMSDGLVQFKKGEIPKPINLKGQVVYPNSLIKHRGKVYIGTRKHGILIYDNDKLSGRIPFKSQIRKMQIDGNQLFILCSDGLYIGAVNSKNFQKLNNSTGLNCDNISEFHVVNNKLYITDSKTLQFISLKELFNESKALPLHFSKILVNGQESAKTSLQPDERKIEFRFNVSTIRYRDNVQYRYKLKGFDDNWQYLDYKDNTITFNALPPGNYQFVAQSINGNATSIPLIYSFVIDAPFHQKWWFYLLLTILSGLIIAGSYTARIRQIRKKNRERLEKQRIQTDLLETELKALRSQMNPHFIFNSLNSIQDLILKQDTDASYDYIVLFADLVRSALNYSNKDYIPIDKEIEFLNVYLSLEKLRFKDDFTYEIIYKGNDDMQVPSMLIQPFIENALLHGLLHKDGNKELRIHFEYKDGLICTITDNGIGRKKAKAIKERQGVTHESFALEAINKRLAIFNQKSGEEYGRYEIDDLYPEQENTGTKVTLYLPSKKYV